MPNTRLHKAICLLILLTGTLSAQHAPGTRPIPLKQLQKDFSALRFGMFIHFGMATYHDVSWAEGTEPASSFNPRNIDCSQWAKAAESAGMKYAVFTAKHVGGFSLWDTAQSDYDVASSPYKKDIVKQYTDAFRKQGLRVGLYFSVWDRHHDIAKKKVTPEKIDHVKAQITELLTNYGKIDFLWLDGYQHEDRNRKFFPDTKEVPFDEIYALAKKLQPNILVMRHPGSTMYDTHYTDVQIWECLLYKEKRKGNWRRYQKENPGGTQELCDFVQNAWFWRTNTDKKPVRSLEYVMDSFNECQENNCNYLLNVAPNRDGQLSDAVLERLDQIGAQVRGPVRSN